MKLFCRLLLSVISVFCNTSKHLFVLSGQSYTTPPEEAFTPMVEKHGRQIIVVQDALGGQPVHRWWKEWKDRESQIKLVVCMIV